MKILTTKTNDEAYWAGFLYADGSFGRNGDRWVFGVTLAMRDHDHLVKLSNTYGNGINYVDRSAIKGGQRYPTCSIKWTSRIEPTHLARWGIVNRKTWNWHEPQIPDHLLVPFLRGWFDGDGGWTGNAAKITNMMKTPLQWYVDQLVKCGYKGRISFGTKNGGKHHCVSFSFREFDRVIRGQPCLERKWV